MDKMETIGDRIAFIASVKASSSKQFAEMLGWSQVMLCRITKNVQGVGLVPVERILSTFPDVDARWLIFGEGAPFKNIKDSLISGMVRLLSYEKYIPVMTETEQMQYLNSIKYIIEDLFPVETVARWEKMLFERENADAVIKKAMKKSIVKEK